MKSKRFRSDTPRSSGPLQKPPKAIAQDSAKNGARHGAKNSARPHTKHHARNTNRSHPPAPPVRSEDLRTIALVGHRSSGKTSLAELLLEAGRVVRERGSVEAGTALLDFGEESRRNRQTAELSTAWFEWAGEAFGSDAGVAAGIEAEADPPRPRLIQLIDTPGAAAMAAVRDVGLAAAEAAVLTLDARAGLEVGAEGALRAAGRLGVPTVAVLSKIDRAIPDLPSLLGAIGRAAGCRAVAVHLPMTDEAGRVNGLIDVIAGRVIRYADDDSGARSPEPVPDAHRPALQAAREQLVDAVAMTDDALLEEYLEYLALPEGKVARGLVRAIRARQIVPVLCASAQRRIGARELLDAIAAWVPPYGEVPRTFVEHDGSQRVVDPEGPFVAMVLSEHLDRERREHWHLVRICGGNPPKGEWVDGRSGARHRVRKLYRMRGQRRAAAPAPVPGMIVATYDALPVGAGTTLTDGTRGEIRLPDPDPPMMALWVRPVNPREEGRMNEALQGAVRSDRGLSLLADTHSGARLLAGADEAHLRIAIDRVVAWGGGVQVMTALPPVGYVETPIRRVCGVEGLFVEKDGDGLVEAYGKCEVDLQPTDPANGTHFIDTLGDIEDDLPIRYRGAIDQGARAALQHGPTAGYPVVGVQLQLTGGAYDILQSTDDHFRLAGERAARIALERTGTRLLEPWLEIEVRAPQGAVGDLISDISAHRGRILGMEVEGPTAQLKAISPYRELRTFASRLRTLTHGRGAYRTRRTHYEAVPDHLLDEAIEASPHRR